MPKVSVIMPVYNTEKYLPQAIESILNQDFSDFEFIILDDCSKDKSFEICQLYAQKDKRIKLFKNKENK
jgi:glycosyltransferase